jgi:hypothetical protein
MNFDVMPELKRVVDIHLHSMISTAGLPGVFFAKGWL